MGRKKKVVGDLEKEIASHNHIDPDSVRLVNPNGRNTRSDKTVKKFKKDWKKKEK